MDERVRCFGSGDPLYAAYHDEEWGRPLADTADERAMYERLVLEGFQAGLSWLTILRKREAFRAAFHGFEPGRVAGFDDRDVYRLMTDTGIVRNRAKITAAIGNARALLNLHDEGLRLTDLIQEHAPAPRQRPPLTFADIPARTDGSTAAGRALKERGFRFVGPTIVYALMEAVGMVDDHIQGCWLAADTPRT